VPHELDARVPVLAGYRRPGRGEARASAVRNRALRRLALDRRRDRVPPLARRVDRAAAPRRLRRRGAARAARTGGGEHAHLLRLDAGGVGAPLAGRGCLGRAEGRSMSAPDDAERLRVNVAAWTRRNAEFTNAASPGSWLREEIRWGMFRVPESELNLLGDVRGRDVVERGCGTADFSAWLAKRGARVVG